MIMHYSDKLVEKIEKEGIPVFDAMQNRIVSTIYYWVISSKFRKSVKLTKWIKKQVDNPSEKLKKYAKNIPTKSNYDAQVIEVLKWVRTALVYTRDTVTWKMLEYWNTVEESIATFKGDCEDGAILQYVLCRLKGVPANRLLIATGDVKGGGHAWLCYKPKNYPMNFVFLDWTYWYNSLAVKKRNLFQVNIKKIEEYKQKEFSWYRQESNYYKIWFMFNEQKAHPRIEYKNVRR